MNNEQTAREIAEKIRTNLSFSRTEPSREYNRDMIESTVLKALDRASAEASAEATERAAKVANKTDIRAAAQTVLSHLLNLEDSDVFEAAQDALDAGEDGPGVLFAALEEIVAIRASGEEPS